MANPDRISLVIALVCAGGFVVGCKDRSGDNATNEENARRPVVLVEPIRRADLAESLVYPVDIEPEVKVSINSLMSERIVKFPWKNGDHIEKGQIVARVRADNATQAQAQMQAELESLDAQIDNQINERSRAEGLLEKGVITRQTYDNLNAQVRVAEAKRKSLEAAISQTAINAGHAVIRAPISGIVANKRVNQGDLAAPQIPLCDIMTEDPVKVVLKIPEREVSFVSLEQSVAIALDAYPNRTFRGTVAKILPYVDPATRTNEVEVVLPNPIHPASKQRLLKPGMFGRATIVTKMSQQALVVPERALLMDEKSREGEMTAFVVEQGEIAKKRTVRTGIREGGRVEILSGLKEREQVVVRGQYGLEDGQPVKLFSSAQGERKEKGASP